MNGWRDTESEGVESRENMKKKKRGSEDMFLSTCQENYTTVFEMWEIKEKL